MGKINFQKAWTKYALKFKFEWSGIIGSIIILCGVLLSTIGYHDQFGAYKITNHFISELGQLHIDSHLGLFNSSLIIGGIFNFIFMIGLGGLIKGFWGKFASLIGAFSTISTMFVGIYPMDYLQKHIIAAYGFFYGGLISVFCFSIAIFSQSNDRENKIIIPKLFGAFGIIVVAIFASFLFLHTSLEPGEARPDFWLRTFLEWMTFFSIIVWILMISITILWNKPKISIKTIS